nr:putative ribonuclease h protein [Quercus suber]
MGWVKLNTDGTMHRNPSKVGGGGVLRSSSGDWIGGFVRKMGNTSSTVAELWALKDGLTMAKQMGFENICIEMDAEFIVQLVSTPSMINLMLEPLLSECRDLIQTFPSSSVVHMFREANGCADRLARMGVDLDAIDFLFLFEPPDVVVEILASDKAGIVCCNRTVVC